LILKFLTLFFFLFPAWSQADWRSQVLTPPASPVVLLGEQHDADEHQALTKLNLALLVRSQKLAGLALEMVDEGFSTHDISPQADEATVRNVLKWNDAGWPWQRYGSIVMLAVRAGVPVVGANLPRSEMSAVMKDSRWDSTVPEAVLKEMRESMITSHCGLLPEAQAPGMARIQIARNNRMAQTVSRLIQRDKTVVLLAGAEHVKKDRGVPLMMSADASAQVQVVWMTAGPLLSKDSTVADLVWQTPPVPFKDYCAELKRALK
jgi:uncharacterized iron-regulated protein